MILVSIIVPVYNSEKYLSETITSLINQNYKKIEVILVDDGSSDSSASICDEFAKMDCRIIVIHKTNGGISSARNRGLREAKGDYIMFCDDDDIFYPYSVTEAVRVIEKTKADIVKFKVKYIYKSDNDTPLTVSMHGLDEDLVYCGVKELLDSYIKIRESRALVYIWNGIYKAELIKRYGIQFAESYKYGGEDTDFNFLYISHSTMIAFSNVPIYEHYRRLGHSTSSKFDSNQIDAVYMNFKQELIMFNNMITSSHIIYKYLVAKYFVGLMSILERNVCPFNRKEIKNQYKNYYKKMIENREMGILSAIQLLKSGLGIKKVVVFELLRHQMFGVLSIISMYLRKHN